jgi:ABC-type sugar transport system ATPase subunit
MKALEPIIKVTGLKKSFKKKEAVKGLDFEVQEGEIGTNSGFSDRTVPAKARRST